MTKLQITDDQNLLLLNDFNKRRESALADIYSLYFNELTYFTRQLYRGTTIEATDVVHDLFIKIWTNHTIQFKELDNIKAYLYISIKNGFLDWISHNKCVDKYVKTEISNSDKFVNEMIESETMTLLSVAIDILPKDIADIFKLIIEEWPIKDIATKLNIPLSSVYAKKSEGINILKNKLHKHSFILLLINSL